MSMSFPRHSAGGSFKSHPLCAHIGCLLCSKLPVPECFKAYEICVSNPYCARKLVMMWFGKTPLWWVVKLKDWRPYSPNNHSRIKSTLLEAGTLYMNEAMMRKFVGKKLRS